MRLLASFILSFFIWITSLCVESSRAQFNQIMTIAGNGQKEYSTTRQKQQIQSMALAPLANPFGIVEESDGSLVICSFDWHQLFRLNPSRDTLTLIAGTGDQGLGGVPGGKALQMQMNQPHEVQVGSDGTIYVADTMNHRVITYHPENQTWNYLAGTGQPGFSGDGSPADLATMNQAYSLAISGQTLFMVDLKNQRLRSLDLNTKVITTLCGTGQNLLPQDGQLASESSLADPRSVAVHDNNIWIVLRGGNSVYRIDRTTQRIYHVAGTGKKGFTGDGGPAKLATFNGPKGIAVDPGVAVYLADTENHAIRKIDLRSGIVSTLVGSPEGKKGFNGDGDLQTVRLLNRPHGVCLLKSGQLVIGDSENHRVRLMTE